MIERRSSDGMLQLTSLITKLIFSKPSILHNIFVLFLEIPKFPGVKVLFLVYVSFYGTGRSVVILC